MCFYLIALFLAQLIVATPTGIVQTDCGLVQGFESQYYGTAIWTFLGIPYAIPPVGALRWQPTVSLYEGNGCWQGTWNASTFGSQCVQFGSGEGNEDCLYINVWSNNLPQKGHQNDLVPVMIFIHGGSLIVGAGGYSQNLARNGDVVTVTFNYRLNAFGYLALEALSQNDPRGVSGNYGLLDQITALKWLQNNIMAFGGDPNRVTIWGQSSGGTSVLHLLLAPSTEGLFHRAISASGSPNITTSLVVAEQAHISDWLRFTPCSNKSREELLDCLYDLSATEVVNACSPAWNPPWLFSIPQPGDYISPLPIIDGVVVPLGIFEAFKSGKVVDVPLILGTMHEEPDTYLDPTDVVFSYTPEEFSAFLAQRFEPFGENLSSQVQELYPLEDFNSTQQVFDSISSDIGDICGNLQLAQLGSIGFKSPIFTYLCTEWPRAPVCALEKDGYCPRYSFHKLDVWFVENDTSLIGYGPEQQEFMELIGDRFKEFATTGYISASTWAPFTQSNPLITYLQLNETLRVNPKAEKCDFWRNNGFSPYMWQN